MLSRLLTHSYRLSIGIRRYASTSVLQVTDLRNILVGMLKPSDFKESRANSRPEYLITSQSQLSKRKMRDSYSEAYLNLKDNFDQQEKYINIDGRIRFGRILEDLDSFAVYVSYKHSRTAWSEGPPPFRIVTATVDQIDILNKDGFTADDNYKFVGQTTWVGKSSIEVTMDILKDMDGSDFKPILKATFVMVVRNANTDKAAIINALEPETEEEKELFQKGENAKLLRIKDVQESVLKVVPSPAETNEIHDIFLETIDSDSATFLARVKPQNSVWMDETKLKNLIICHPESRNVYNKIFGGFLMRQGYELGWANATLYANKVIRVVSVDNVCFLNSVPIGSLLFLSSSITYTEGPYIQVKVFAQCVDPKTQQRMTTNSFHFTFKTLDDSPVYRVLPKSYAEAMLYLEGKRHFLKTMSHRET